MAIEDELLERERALVERGEVDVALLRRFMQGGVGEVIETEGGLLNSLATLQNMFFNQFGDGTKQYKFSAQPAPTQTWQKIARVEPGAEGEDGLEQDMILLTSGNESLDARSGGTQMLRLSIRDGSLQVTNLNPFTPHGQFGYVEDGRAVELWVRTDGRRNRLTVTVLNDGGGVITVGSPVLTSPPVGISYPAIIEYATKAEVEKVEADNVQMWEGLIGILEAVTETISGES